MGQDEAHRQEIRPQVPQRGLNPVDPKGSPFQAPLSEGSPPEKPRTTREHLSDPEFLTLLFQRYAIERKGGKDGMVPPEKINMGGLENDVLREMEEMELNKQKAREPITQTPSFQPVRADAAKVPHEDSSELTAKELNGEFVPLQEVEKKIQAWYGEENRERKIMLSVLYRGLVEASKTQIITQISVIPRPDVRKVAQRLSELCAVGSNNRVDIYRAHLYSVHAKIDVQSFESVIRQKLQNPVEINLQKIKSMGEDVRRRIRPMLDFWASQWMLTPLLEEVAKRTNNPEASREDLIAAETILKTLTLYLNTYTSNGRFLSKPH